MTIICVCVCRFESKVYVLEHSQSPNGKSFSFDEMRIYGIVDDVFEKKINLKNKKKKLDLVFAKHKI